MNKSLIISAIAGIVGLTVVALNVGINDAGYRTVIQKPNGSMSVKFEPGLYFPMFGKTTTYPDFISKDFGAGEDNVCSFAQNDGVRVRYQDGGEGVVCGMVNVALPTDEDSMLKFHNRFRSEEGARTKLLNQEFPKVLNLTAGLLKSEEAYATKRSEFISNATYQANNGLYETKLVSKRVQVGVDKEGKPEYQNRDVPEIVLGTDGQPKTADSIIDRWNLAVTQFDLKAWDFEPKTLKQISDKRDAEMAIITAKANANKAYYAEQQVIAEGKKNVAQMEYKTKAAAARQIEEAKRDKQLAVIAATKQKETAIELTAAAEEATKQKAQEALAAIEEAKVITTLADAEAYAIDKKQEAGKLFREFEMKEHIATVNSRAVENMNMPSQLTILGGGAGGNTDAMNSLLQLGVMDKLGTLSNAKTVSK
jgi:hypothetical protein